MSTDPVPARGSAHHDVAAQGADDAGVPGPALDDAGVPGPGVDAPLFATGLHEVLDQALRTFAEHDRVLVALDFDGALAPIVRDPRQARMLPTSAQAVGELTTLPGVVVAVVSGREAADLVRLTDVPTGTRMVGSHGAQWGTSALAPDGTRVLEGAAVDLTPEQTALRAELLREAEELVAGVEGAWVHAKPAAVVVHTRTASREDAERVTEAALAGPGARAGVHALHGKEVVEMAVTDVTKGDALHRLRADTGADAVLYAGDDRTDEDAFAALGEEDVTIKVGEGQTRAQFRVPDPEGLAAVLMRLVELLGHR